MKHWSQRMLGQQLASFQGGTKTPSFECAQTVIFPNNVYWLRYDVQLIRKLGVHQQHWPGRLRCCPANLQAAIPKAELPCVLFLCVVGMTSNFL